MNLKKKNILIVSVTVILLLMTVGYAGLKTVLMISGNVSVEQTFDVAITNISSTNTGEAYNIETPSYTGTTASFNVGLKSPGDKMVYNITITNNGTLDAYVKSIDKTIQCTNKKQGDIFDNVSAMLSGLRVGDALKAGQSATYKVEIRDDENEVYLENPNYAFKLDMIFAGKNSSIDQTAGFYDINDPVYLADGSVWRVVSNMSRTDSHISLIKEEPLTISNTPGLFENNPELDITKMNNYLNTTYKNSLSSEINSKINSIGVPSIAINNKGNYNYSEHSIDGLLYHVYNVCSNLENDYTNCDIGWLGNYVTNSETSSPGIYPQMINFGHILAEVPYDSEDTSISTSYKNIKTVDNLDITDLASASSSNPVELINQVSTTSFIEDNNTYGFNSWCAKEFCGNGNYDEVPYDQIKVYPVIDISIDAIK